MSTRSWSEFRLPAFLRRRTRWGPMDVEPRAAEQAVAFADKDIMPHHKRLVTQRVFFGTEALSVSQGPVPARWYGACRLPWPRSRKDRRRCKANQRHPPPHPVHGHESSARLVTPSILYALASGCAAASALRVVFAGFPLRRRPVGTRNRLKAASFLAGARQVFAACL